MLQGISPQTPPQWDDSCWPESLAKLVRATLSRTPTERPTARQLVNNLAAIHQELQMREQEQKKVTTAFIFIIARTARTARG